MKINWILACALLALIAGLALAQDEEEEVVAEDEAVAETVVVTTSANDYIPMTDEIDGHTWGIVVRKDVTLFGIPVGAGGFTVEERTVIIADQRLDVLYDGGVLEKSENIRVGKINNEVCIFVKNPDNVGGLPDPTLILTIDRNFEKFLDDNRWDIAYYWRDIMRKWSRKGLMKSIGGDGTGLDPAGRPLDKKNSWRKIPAGYRNKAIASDKEGSSAPAAPSAGGIGGKKIPGAD